MGRYFLDTSALVKRYHQESGSAEVEALINSTVDRVIISRLTLVEIYSGFARLVREGVVTESGFRKVIARFRNDITTRITVAAVSSRRLQDAASILSTHGLKNNLRSLDAIQLATAQALHARSPLTALVAADKKLLAVAAGACGLTTLDVG